MARNVFLDDLKVGTQLSPKSGNYNNEDWTIKKIEDGKIYYDEHRFDDIETCLAFRKFVKW